MSARRHRTGGLVAATLSVSLLLAGCTGHRAHRTAATVPPPSSTSATPTTSAPAPKPAPAPVDPLTGGAVSKSPVVAVKIDDTAPGRPQRNINAADIVYMEQVEGGLTRLLAIFHSKLPVVEAVRSTRNNDPEILGEYGPIGFVTSGGAPHPIAVLRASVLRASVDDWGGPGLFRDDSRPQPYNLMANLATVATAVKAGPARNVGFTWAKSWSYLSSCPVAGHVATVVGSTPVRFNWDPASGRYDRIIDGVGARDANGDLISTPNVIVQYVRVTPDPSDVDVMGSVSMFTHSVGSGSAVVFRNGRRVPGSWSRSSTTSGTVFRNAQGGPIELAPGGAYVLLVAAGTPIS